MSQEIATTSQTQMNLGIPTSEQRLSEKLSALVLSRDNPIVGPNSAAELRAFAEQPEPPLATQQQVDTLLAKLAIATASPKISQAEANERLEIYWLAIKDIPVSDLRAAFMELIRTAKFLPTPAELRTVALAAGSKRRAAKNRAKHLVWLHEKHWIPEPAERVDPAEIRALIAQIGGEEKNDAE